MSLVALLVTLVVVGVLLYLVRLIPMDATVQKIITVVVILAVVLWVASSLGFMGLGTMGFPRVR